MKWDVVRGYEPNITTGEVLGQALGRQPEVRQHRALPYEEVAAVTRSVQVSETTKASTLAFEFLVLITVRSSGVCLAR